MANILSYRVNGWSAQGWIDTTQDALIWPIVEFQGWVAFQGHREEFEIWLNGAKLQIQSFVARRDVEEALGVGWAAVGWNALCDVGPSARDNEQALLLEIRVRGQIIARKYFRYKNRSTESSLPLKIVLHMPKTGGTSLRTALGEHQGALFILPLYHDFTIINNLSSSSMDCVDVIFGHTTYGIHDHFARQAKYFTVLRNPYDFVSSLYFYKKYVQEDAEMLQASNILEALSSVKCSEFDNYYTRSISGLDKDSTVTEEHLEKAISNIDSHFSFIGLAERPRETFKSFSRIFGLPLSYVRENVSPDMVEREFIDSIQVNDVIRESVRLDIKLYQHVVRKFWNMEIA
ncbi:hypothetical protein [Agrobacterium vitis]|uniref:hypothetical protein n=1 Tax=Agrobacterium vitis TaxID=373 RepID=UPI001574544E|nr:hypothetical protein [Agrobacterium vitis]NSZ16623.1 hypothetical protein [Agrobacterium vitis]QZO05381.1 sulfotransferase family protein [Agrobacterium vitis]UJL87527.1 hypothetical protein AVF2S5_06020 [Agrobacterium vitis]BCH59754.1 hypothetical protein RvVAR0630_23780 [Agrobacterium vitis]